MKNKVIIAFLLMISLWPAACFHEEPVESDASKAPEMPDQEIWDSKVKMTNKGDLSAIIHFGHMSRYTKKSLMLFDQGIDIDFYNDKGVVGSQLISEAGEYSQDTKNVRATGNVAVESDSGLTLYTQELFYYQDSDRILSNVDVMVCTVEGDTLYGRGFESDTQMNNWEIKQPYDGVAHKSVDLSFERFQKKAEADSAVMDSTIAVDSLSVPESQDAVQP